MAKPVIKPKVHTEKVEKFSLKDMQKRLHEGPSKVRVGLPDSLTTEAEEKLRAQRQKRRAARSGRKP